MPRGSISADHHRAEALRQQRQEFKRAKSTPFRDFLIAEPTLRFLLALGWAVAVVVAAKIFRSHLAPTLHGWIDTHHVHVDPKTLLGIERLVGGLIILAGLNVGASLFVIQGLPAGTQAYYDALRSKIFNAGFFLAFGYGLLKVIDIWLDTAGRGRQEAGTVDAPLVRIARNTVKGGLIFGILLLVFENFSELHSLLLMAGVAGLAAALASREILSNLFATVSILAQRLFAVGDRIQVGGLDGYVETVGLLSTRLRTQDGTLAVVPNRIPADSVVNNLSRRPHTRKAFTIRLHPGCPGPKLDRALSVLRAVLKDRDGIQDGWAHLAQFAPAAMEIQVNLWMRQTDPRRVLEELEELNLEIKRRFDADGITEHMKS